MDVGEDISTTTQATSPAYSMLAIAVDKISETQRLADEANLWKAVQAVTGKNVILSKCFTDIRHTHALNLFKKIYTGPNARIICGIL